MYKGMSASEFIARAESKFTSNSKNADFTKHLLSIKDSNPELYKEVITLLNNGTYKVKFLSFAGTSY